MERTAALFPRAIDQFGSRVAQITDDQWSNPTPCTEWDVRALVRHLVYEVVWFDALMRGETIAEVGDRFEGDILGADPRAAWARGASAALAAAAEPDALDRTVDLSRGRAPAEEYMWELIMDLTVHGWDLARGIGADDTMDPELTERLWTLLQTWMERLRASGAFADPVRVPDDASVQAKLLAMLGRASE